MTRPSARVIADSVDKIGQRIITMEVTMHRFVLAELNTHRAFSRNSASSRAVPIQKMIDRVLNDPAIPISWTSEQPGMVGGTTISDETERQSQYVWLNARDHAVRSAQLLANSGVHKSIVNRLLEPFAWHTVIITSTEWQNFFVQRCHPAAQPEMAAAAYAMRDAILASKPREVAPGSLHTPYLLDDEESLIEYDRIRLSVARCARVSYLTHDGTRDHERDFDLYDKLVSAQPAHASPLEHVAISVGVAEQHFANFTGWRSLRHMMGI